MSNPTNFPTSGEALRNIYTSLKPIYLSCKFLGLNTIRITPVGQFITEKCHDYYYFVFYLTLYSILTVYTIISILGNTMESVVVNKYIFLVECCVMMILMLFVVSFTFFFRKLQTKALNLLSNVDVAFMKHGFAFQYRQFLKRNYTIFGVIVGSLVVRSVFIFLTLRADWVQYITLCISASVKAFSKYQFVALVLQLQVRFTKINTIIRSYYQKKTHILLLSPAVKTIPERLHVLCRLHYKLTSVTEKVNSAFAVQLLVSTGVSLFDILFQSYYLYFVATGKAASVDATTVLSPIVWLLDETIEIYWLVFSCATTCDQANETPTNLHELRNNFYDLDIENQVQTYSLQMLHQKVQFSVLGFFEIDYTLIYSIVGAVTTYLVIFIQFDQSSNAQSLDLKNVTGLGKASCV